MIYVLIKKTDFDNLPVNIRRQILTVSTTSSNMTPSTVTLSSEEFYKIESSLENALLTELKNYELFNKYEIEQIINSGEYEPEPNAMLYDSAGRPISRSSFAPTGWHYQAHSVQFEVNKLGSLYNKDDLGNDLGFCEIKIYDDEDNECVTQGSADTDGVKTIVTWKPDFDFAVISGNIRQLTKETVDSYLYVNGKIYTGLPAPYDYLKVPFVQGGINLNYIGADEPLKTDGRSAKLIKGSNTDYFEIICNYDADLLTNNNRHKMSVIFEIFKDPMI